MDPAPANSKALQALGALDGALATARAAVLAAHPELLPPQGEGPLKLGAAGWMGDELLDHIAALSDAITRYAVAVEMERARLQRRRRAA